MRILFAMLTVLILTTNAIAQTDDVHSRTNILYKEFIDPAMHCPESPDLWQERIHFAPLENGPGREFDEYFLVRWKPPFHFSMIEVSDHPKPGCTEGDKEADEPRTLFLH